MEKLILIKYGELTTKKGNRNLFINKLYSNMKNILKGHKVDVQITRDRMYVRTNEDIDEISLKISKVFGIHALDVAYKLPADEDAIKELALKLITLDSKTFKVETKRADKTFPTGSMEFNRIIAGHILKNTGLKVDVHNPDLRLKIEIRRDGAYVYTKEIKGAGGYPVGIQGKGLLMLSGGIDSPVAGYLALKRGVDIEGIYFDSPPHTSKEAKDKVIELANIINSYSGNVKLHVIPFTEIQETIYKEADNSYMITMMRRMMYRISEKVAHKTGCKIIVNGESIGQVASQTLDSISVINSVTTMPVIRPVATLDKLEIIKIAEKIGTYDTSILPFEDCCTIFLPKNPVIAPKMNKCLEFEKKVNYDDLIERAVQGMETITNLNKNKFQDIL